MPFGKFKGTPLEALDDGHIGWLLSIELREPLFSAVLREARRRRIEEAPARPQVP